MNGIILFLAAGLGIQHGWTQADDGTVEYIVQVDEAGIEALRDGLPLSSALPSGFHRIDRVRIQVGQGPVPRSKIVNNKPAVIPASLNVSDLSDAANRFAGSIQEFPAKLKTDAINSVANSTDDLKHYVSEKAYSVLNRAADEIPMLAQNQPSSPTGGGWLPQANGYSAASSQPTAVQQQQPRIRPGSGQQSVTGSTQYQSDARQSSFGQTSGSYPNDGSAPRVADANNNSSGNAVAPNGQQDPNDTRTIGSFNPNQTQPQPGYPTREQNPQTTPQPAQQTGQQPAPNTALDSRNGQMSIQRPAPDYQSAFSADSRSPRNNNLDMYADQPNGYNLEPVRRPSSAGQTGNGSVYNNIPNSQFNSRTPQQQAPPAGPQNQQQAGQNVNGQQQNGPAQTWPPPYWPANNQANNTAINPYQYGINPLTGLPMPGLQGINPYAPNGVWGMQSLTPPGGYTTPYIGTRGLKAEEDPELAKRDRKIDELVNAVEKLQRGNDVLTNTSNEIGKDLTEKEPAKPSTQWSTVLIFLFGSIGANFYLAWIALSFYHRYRTLSDDMRDSLAERIDTR